MLFVREENKRIGGTLPFLCLGFADYVSHEGEQPMAIRWRLQRAIPEVFVPELAWRCEEAVSVPRRQQESLPC